MIDRIYDKTPGFEDVFHDEETFYAFAACFTALACVAAFVASRYWNGTRFCRLSRPCWSCCYF